MKRLSSSRRGSALLVVLGMLAFMVVSGLAFAVFMRATRMPSSFTRRTVATRQLAKAALAQAIDQIDRAIANDPHPGVRLNNENDYNYWIGRVLLSTDTTSGTQKKPNSVWSELSSDPNENGCKYTVPVLSLEALAYIPPPLVNEARFYGQKTSTATWQTFDFDAGRYAFIALDVSDYFDVNRLVADEARSSNPGRRVTFGYAFDDAEHIRWKGGASQWEAFMDAFRSAEDDGTFSYGSKTPLVSLADFNLAVGTRSIGNFKSPFVQYVKNGAGGDGFYNSAPGDENFEKYAEMTFVADSLDAPVLEAEKKTDEGLKILDLDDEDNQPFTESFLKQSQKTRTLNAVRGQGSQGFDRLLNHGVPQVALCALSDYLDGDRIPISLGMPSVERVPMICGIRPTVGESAVSVKLKRVLDEDKVVSGGGAEEETKTVKRTVHWRLDPVTFRSLVGGGAGLDVLTVYPFQNHENLSEGGYFKMDGKLQFFLSTDLMPLRTLNQDDLLHFGADASDGGRQGGVAALCAQAKLVGRAVFNFPLKDETIEIETGTDREQKDCVKLVNLSLDRTSSAQLINEELDGEKGDVLRVTYQWVQKREKKEDGTFTDWKPKFENEIPQLGTADANVQVLNSGDDKPAASLLALGTDGAVDSGFLDTAAKSPDKDITLYLNMAATVRVKSSQSSILGTSGSGTMTMDMVPATAYDDALLNGIENTGSRLQNVGGKPGPLMKFCSASCKLNPQKSADAGWEVEASPKSVLIDDPRYNYAPENWSASTANFSEEGWLGWQTSASKDGDIFMASSDQNYLQSVYELGFVPRFSNLEEFADELRGNLGNYDGDERTQLGTGSIPDANLMWKTYDIFGRYSNVGDDFEGLGFENNGRGLRVNPFSDSTNVILAAFANTPLDWRLASDADDSTLNPAMGMDAESFNRKYAWNEYSTGGKISWPALSAIAGEFMADVRTRAVNNNGDWRDALTDIFDRERQYDTSDYLCGIDLKLDEFKPESGESSPIYSVDKKFLYGFWRNCFAARQQLFLVFFRAEPMMLGGGVAGVTPPQLGAKGMAVVWRNPNKTNGAQNNNNQNEDGYVPHQTRVLFYRQFE